MLCPLLTCHWESGFSVWVSEALFLSAVRYRWVLPTRCSVKLAHSQFACAALPQGLVCTLLASPVDKHFLMPWLIKKLSCQDHCWTSEVGLQSSKITCSSVVLACKHRLALAFWIRKPCVPAKKPELEHKPPVKMGQLSAKHGTDSYQVKQSLMSRGADRIHAKVNCMELSFPLLGGLSQFYWDLNLLLFQGA